MLRNKVIIYFSLYLFHLYFLYVATNYTWPQKQSYCSSGNTTSSISVAKQYSKIVSLLNSSLFLNIDYHHTRCERMSNLRRRNAIFRRCITNQHSNQLSSSLRSVHNYFHVYIKILTILNLQNNHITSTGIQYLTDALRNNKVIKMLSSFPCYSSLFLCVDTHDYLCWKELKLKN